MEGWHWDDNEGRWFEPELCAQARREEVEYIRRDKMYVRVPREVFTRGSELQQVSTAFASERTQVESDSNR